MVSIREKKIHAAFDKLDLTLDRIAEIPAHELTFQERLTLWAQLETLRLALTDAAQRGQRFLITAPKTEAMAVIRA